MPAKESKKLIFTNYTNKLIPNHGSVSPEKTSQFEKYHNLIVERQREYAEFCKADYIKCDSKIQDYNQLQFEKIFLLEKFAKDYDEIIYFDFDAVPNKGIPNLFDTNPEGKLRIHPVVRTYRKSEMDAALRFDQFDSMNMFVKICAKWELNQYLGFSKGPSQVYNTGVIVGDSKTISKLRFKDRLPLLNEALENIKRESIFPKNISDRYSPNNEVYITHLLETRNIPNSNLSMAWNFILDPTANWLKPELMRRKAYIIHHIGKQFEISFDEKVYETFLKGTGSVAA